MASRAHRTAGLVRSLSLLWTFVLASAVILAAGTLILSSVLAQSFREQVLDSRGREVALYANSVLAPTLVRGDHIVGERRALARLRRTIRTPEEFTGVAIWSPKGGPVFSTIDGPRQVSARRQARAVLRSGPSAEVLEVSHRRDGSRPVRTVVVWGPLTTARGKPVGVVQVHLRPDVLDASVAQASRTVWIAVFAVFGTLWLTLTLFVRGAARRLARQNDTLEAQSREVTATSRQVERNLLDTIDTLNAAVEARDPYTAGHSQRVRRVALAVGRELAFKAPRLGTLATAALFHDIGKIGIPDAVLTKADKLEPGEAAIMREHVERGAEIVAKVSSFEDAVVAIRHHHERWDGLGYPDGLAGDDIPLEAAIIGLADAWDAMTTHRPYAEGLTLNEAMLQVRSGRGKQFSPVVVDAFFEVAKRRPSEILPPDERSVGFGSSA